MKFLLINPNSSQAVTEALRQEAERCGTELLQVDVIGCPAAPRTIVTSFDEMAAGLQVVELLRVKAREYDGAIIGCFADPGLKAAREQISIPVTGLYESSAIFARMRGRRYSIIASGSHLDISPWIGSARALGEMENLASVRYIDSTVERAVDVKNEKICRIIEKCRREDGADAVILGCAAFAGRGRLLSQMMAFPVIDGIEESVRVTEMLVNHRRERGDDERTGLDKKSNQRLSINR